MLTLNTTTVYYLQCTLDMLLGFMICQCEPCNCTVTDTVITSSTRNNPLSLKMCPLWTILIDLELIQIHCSWKRYTDKFNLLNIQRVTWTCTCFSTALRKFGGRNAEQSHLPSYRLLAAVRKVFRHSMSESLIRESSRVRAELSVQRWTRRCL